MSRPVIQKVQRDFPIDEQASVLEFLSLYGSRDQERKVREVRMRILEQAEGDREKLVQLVQWAKRDHHHFLTESGKP